MGVRVRQAGDDPDELWFQCPDCEGTGRLSVPDGESWLAGDESVFVETQCPGCDGLGMYRGDSDEWDEVDGTVWM